MSNSETASAGTTLGVTRIVSGGQTGVDRGALEAAIALGIAHGGWCPRGRLAEDGTVPSRYELVECDAPGYHVRTERNVVDSDGTLILYRHAMSGGTALTFQYAKRHGKPFFLHNLAASDDAAAARDWLVAHRIRTLNVGGPRESNAPGAMDDAMNFVLRLLS